MNPRIPIVCDGCGARHEVAWEKYPPAGGRYPCPKCRTAVVFPPRTFWEQSAQPDPPPPVEPAPDSDVFRVVASNGAEERLTRFEVRDRIRAGAIDAGTRMVQGAGSDWKPAEEFPELARYFALARQSRPAVAAVPGAPSCRRHAGAAPEASCGFCGAEWCGECVRRENRGGKDILRCPADGDLCSAIVAPVEIQTLFGRAISAIPYPVAGGGIFFLASYCALVFLGSLFPVFFPLSTFLVIFLFLASLYPLEIVRVSAEGEKSLPHWPDGSDILVWIGRGGKIIVVTAIALAPLIAFNVWILRRMIPRIAPVVAQLKGSGAWPALESAAGAWLPRFLWGNALLLIVCLAYYPMSLAFAAVWDTVWPALNPLLIARGIRSCGLDYLGYLVLLVASSAGVVLGAVALRLVPFGFLLLLPLQAAVFFWQMHLLGWTIYRHRETLGWG